MPEEVSVRETTTSTSETSNALKERLSSVRDALQEIESEVRQDAESLERLRSLLDLTYIDEFSQIINDLEVQIRQVGEDADRAARERDEARERLAEEEDRLEKLWDVYKNQERDLEKANARIRELETDAREKEDKVSEIRAEMEASQRALNQAQEAEGKLRREKTELLAQVEDLKALEDSQQAIDELETELEREQERLTKLYAAYEEAQAERDEAVGKLKRWEVWRDHHASSLQAVCRAGQELPDE